ncbi:Chitinase 2 [Neonectria magnoliae]|uniref:Chitinase 2 n=1 Tax=Neonectria magnoliae TaxID=2732573 RepID=A0ABR1HYB0_9HYPO
MVKEFYDGYTKEFGKPLFLHRALRWRWETADKVTSEERDEGWERIYTYRKWLLDNIFTERSILVLPIDEGRSNYRDAPPPVSVAAPPGTDLALIDFVHHTLEKGGKPIRPNTHHGCTITSCLPYVTDCPIGSVTTEIATAYTTYCPGAEATRAPVPETLTSTLYSTKVYTVTACPPNVTNCPVGSLTTEAVISYSTYCPGAENTKAVTTKFPHLQPDFDLHIETHLDRHGLSRQRTLHQGLPDHRGLHVDDAPLPVEHGHRIASSGSIKTIDHIITVYPASKNSAPPVNNATTTYYPSFKATAKVPVCTEPPYVPTYTEPDYAPTEPAPIPAVAAWNAPGLMAMVVGVVLAAIILASFSFM